MQIKFVFALLLICVSTAFARVPPRTNHETAVDTDPKESPIQTPVERSPIDSEESLSPMNGNSSPNKKPISVILFRTQPAFSVFRDRSPFTPMRMSSPFDHPHFSANFGNSGFGGHSFGSSNHDDPALRLISLLFGNRLRPIQPESTPETEPMNESGESSDESSELDRRHPFDSLFPNIFVPNIDEMAKEPTATEDKTPDNFENKENKVIKIGDKKYVKTTSVKKVKNDFGSFHSVISSYQPFDEKIHDENGNEKIRPSESDNKETSIDKKDVESTTAGSSTTAVVDDKIDDKVEKVDSSTPVVEKIDASSTTSAPEKEEATKAPETSSPKPSDKLIAENLSKEVSKNEIPDNTSAKPADKVEIKVDQMN